MPKLVKPPEWECVRWKPVRLYVRCPLCLKLVPVHEHGARVCGSAEQNEFTMEELGVMVVYECEYCKIQGMEYFELDPEAGELK
jgi:hypothetical protein